MRRKLPLSLAVATAVAFISFDMIWFRKVFSENRLPFLKGSVTGTDLISPGLLTLVSVQYVLIKLVLKKLQKHLKVQDLHDKNMLNCR